MKPRYDYIKTLIVEQQYTTITVDTELSQNWAFQFDGMTSPGFFLVGFSSVWNIEDIGVAGRIINHRTEHVHGEVRIKTNPTSFIGDNLSLTTGFTAVRYQLRLLPWEQYDFTKFPVYISGNQLTVFNLCQAQQFTPVGSLRWVVNAAISLGFLDEDSKAEIAGEMVANIKEQ